MRSCQLSQHEERYKLGCNLQQVISCSSSALQITTTGTLLNYFTGLVYTLQMATQTVISTGNPSFQRWVEENKDLYTVNTKKCLT